MNTNNSESYTLTQGTRPGFVFIISVLAALLVVACKEVTFRDPQPKGIRSLQQVPTRMQGYYLVADDSGKVDTLVISTNSFYSKREPTKDSRHLSDTLIMKTYKGYYFFNQRDRNDPTWLLRIVKQEKNGDLHYLAMDDERFNEFLVKLSREIRVDSVDLGKGMIYTIDPTPKQLMSLIEKGYFIKQAKFKKLK
jgi:hypothetical protein